MLPLLGLIISTHHLFMLSPLGLVPVQLNEQAIHTLRLFMLPLLGLPASWGQDALVLEALAMVLFRLRDPPS